MTDKQGSNYINRSKTYLLPLLLDVLDVDLRFINMVENTYLFEESGKYDNCIFVEIIFAFDNPEFIKFEHSLKDSYLFRDKIDIDSNKVIFIYDFPTDYMSEYLYYLEGKYSKFSKAAVDVILNYYRNIYKEKRFVVEFLIRLNQIFNKDDNLRKELELSLKTKIKPGSELTDIMDFEKELINLNILNESNIIQ